MLAIISLAHAEVWVVRRLYLHQGPRILLVRVLHQIGCQQDVLNGSMC